MKNWKKNIALFMTGQGISMFGSMMVHYAIMWHITLQTQSGLMMTFITIAGTIPMFLISPFGGVWADRYNKKHVINIADSIIALVSLAMAILFSVGIEYSALLLVCLVMRSFGQGVQNPAVNALIPTITPEDKLTKVNGINGSIQSLVLFTSPMAGAAILMFAPISTLLFIDVITAAIGIGTLLFFVKTPNQEKKETKLSYFHDVKEGIKYIATHPFVKKFLVLSVFYNIMIAPAAIMTPLQVARNWGDGVWQLPLFNLSFGAEQRLATIEVTFFVGMMIGGLIMGAWGGFKNKTHSLALSVALNGIGAIGLGMLTNFWAYSICMGLTGLVLALFNAPMMSILQTNVEANYMGRVFSVSTMVASVAMPIGMVVFGPLGDIVKIDWLLIGTGVALFFLAFVFVLDKTLLKAGLKEDRK